MIGQSLEEPCLLGFHLSQVGWGRMAGMPAAGLRRPAETAKVFLVMLGGPADAAATLDEEVVTAPGRPRSLSSTQMLDDLTAFRTRAMWWIDRDLSPRQAAALRLGFHAATALALSQVAAESPGAIRAPLLEILGELARDAKALDVGHTDVADVLSLARGATGRLDFGGVHARISRLCDDLPRELRALGP